MLLGVSLGFGQDNDKPLSLVCEYQTNPIGIDVLVPRLSWKFHSQARGWMQSEYRIQVATSADDWTAGSGRVWDSGKVLSDASIHRDYEGPPLESGARYYWRARVWDQTDQPSGWSDAAYWEMGLLETSDWQAQWITPDWEEDTSRSQPPPMLRRSFAVTGEVVSARAYVTSLGLYQMELNGRRVGDALFTPGWTSYGKRLQYQTYDITDYLERGDNVVGVTLGDGWYRGVLGF